MKKIKMDTPKAEGYLLKFNEMNSNGDVFAEGCINPESLDKLKMSGQIKDYSIDENGVKVISEFTITSASIGLK